MERHEFNELCNKVINLVIDATFGESCNKLTMEGIAESIHVCAAVAASCIMGASASTSCPQIKWKVIFDNLYEENIKHINEIMEKSSREKLN